MVFICLISNNAWSFADVNERLKREWVNLCNLVSLVENVDPRSLREKVDSFILELKMWMNEFKFLSKLLREN